MNDRAASKLYDSSAKELRAVLDKYDKLAPVQGNGGKVLNPVDAKFRQSNERELEGLRKSLRRIIERYEDTPAGERASELLALLS